MTDDNPHLDEPERIYFGELRGGQAQAETALNSFLRFLAIKYKLKEGDDVRADGRITRSPVRQQEVP